ncbi:uncharacterized protein E0L32_002191 [Thyridium curvatum]|uniref:Uncharacterized protein n=1 Tax=Thyridium curvatum TaxID=1093900 RepID=A0A507ACW3_9PEZI|nr:uncharacterized protein E0L32_002191 [Thyridium curvatum]TPX06695.1 hypothetical protein E0L32_002191 [Thyridium curvatum]
MSSHGEIVTIDIRTFNDPSGDLAAFLRRSPEHWLAVSSMFPSSPKPELACFPGIIPNQAVMVEDLRELYENSLSELPDGAVIKIKSTMGTRRSHEG